MQAKITLEDWRVIDITLTPEQQKAMEVKKVWRWKPKVGEDYYFPKSSSAVEPDEYQWKNDDADNNFYNHWMVFKTHKEAQFYLEKREFITKVNDRIDELNDWWVADWSNPNKAKHYFYNNTIGKSNLLLWISCTFNIRHATIFHYMKSEQVANQIISEFKDDLMKYIFN